MNEIDDPAITDTSVWEHIEEVIVPQIRQRQVQLMRKERTLGQALLELSSVAPVHEVCIFGHIDSMSIC